MLGGFAALQQRVAGAAIDQALIDDPRERLDVRAAQVFLQRGGFMHGGGLRQGDKQDAGELRVAEAFEEFQHFLGLGIAGLPLEFPLICFAGIEQK